MADNKSARDKIMNTVDKISNNSLFSKAMQRLLEQTRQASTPAQRLEAVENSLIYFFQNFNNVVEEVQTLYYLIDALLQVLQIDKKTISDLMNQKIVSDLKNKLDSLLEQKIIKPADKITSPNFFVVVREIEKGEVVNSRIQFPLYILSDDTISLFINKKVGDAVYTDPNNKEKYFEIQEIYETLISLPNVN